MHSKLILSLLALVAATASAETRKWTSAEDATKSFLAEFSGLKDGKATFRLKNGKPTSLPLEKLSADDQAVIKALDAAETAKTEAAAMAAKARESVIAKELGKKVLILDGKKLKKHDVFATKAPEYYLVYWGASW